MIHFVGQAGRLDLLFLPEVVPYGVEWKFEALQAASLAEKLMTPSED